MHKSYEAFLGDVHKLVGVDLSGYKRPQMERRINNLMRSVNAGSYEEYIQILRENKEHCLKFLNHITINVSEFFRNPQQWDVLKDKIIPDFLLGAKSLRIWSAGCSTGEEPYTLAILLSEYFPNLDFQILASDLDNQVLEKAQMGFYSDKALVNLPKHLVSKYFTGSAEIFQVKASLKQKIKFVHHNLLKDPFGSNYDMILCRNVVIYFTEETKNKLYLHFHAALRPGGVLFIGSTEQIFNSRNIGFLPLASFFYQKTIN